MTENRTFVTLSKRGRIAIASVDNPPVNALTRDVREGLMTALLAAENDLELSTLVLMCEGKTFFAGGDVREFDGVPPEPHLPDVVQAFENSRLIIIAAIHGTCFGGGMEMALACDYRIADRRAKFSFPEVALGLIPGAGGTQRLPRLIGYRNAAEMLTSGAPFSANKMQEFGAIDVLVDEALLEKAHEFAKGINAKRTPISARVVQKQNVEDITAKYSKGALAPKHNLEALSWSTLPFEQGQPKERALHLELRKSVESKALRHIFFSEKSAAKPNELKDFTPRALQNIAVLGGGLMGSGIAAACLMAGKTVQVFERSEEMAHKAFTNVNQILSGAEARGKLGAPKSELLTKFSAQYILESVAQADLVIEAVFEDLGVKREVFEAIIPFLKPDAIITTNTSYIDPEEIIPAGCHQRAAGLHFFSPAHIMKLVEVVRLGQSDLQVLADLFGFVRALKKQPVLSGICDGFIGNRILAVYRREAEYLLADGASVEQIDGAMRDFGYPMGPFESQDLAGLQIAWANRKRQAAARVSSERYVTISDTLCEAQRFGKRAGAGWYDYLDGQKTPSDDVQSLIEKYRAEQKIAPQIFSQETLQNRLLAVMVNEANLIVEEGIAAKGGDVDVVKIAGYAFPRWKGGPVCYGDQNLEKMRVSMKEVAEQSPQSWRTSNKLQQE